MLSVRGSDSAGPEVPLTRPICCAPSDDFGDMVDADLAAGDSLGALIARFLAKPGVSYLHAHFAKRGCYAARIDRG